MSEEDGRTEGLKSNLELQFEIKKLQLEVLHLRTCLMDVVHFVYDADYHRVNLLLEKIAGKKAENVPKVIAGDKK